MLYAEICPKVRRHMCLKCIDSIKIGKSYSFKFKKYLISAITMNCQIFNFPNLELALF
jgi:RNase P subunit RPR2